MTRPGWQYLIALVTTVVVAPGVWLLLDYLMPPDHGCRIFDMVTGGNCSPIVPYPSLLHCLAGAIIAGLSSFAVLRGLYAWQNSRDETTNPKH